MAAGTWVDESTYPGHCWRVRDEATRNLVAAYCATDEPAQFVRFAPQNEVRGAALTELRAARVHAARSPRCSASL
eukprot:5006214-Prymnesium_polylepis.1